jgi:pimeloyl-ACP methyl ester carboxylesterase
MTKIVYIHGASATGESFNYIRQQIHQPDLIMEYNSACGFVNNLHDMIHTLRNERGIFFVAHSLGGIYAMHLAQHMPKRIVGAVTISTPYGGSEVADIARWFLPFSRLMRDIGPNDYPMQETNHMKLPCAWTNIVTTCGASPFISEPNDGVVTHKSMRHHADKMQLIDVPLNHYEVLLSNRTVNIIDSAFDK